MEIIRSTNINIYNNTVNNNAQDGINIVRGGNNNVYNNTINNNAQYGIWIYYSSNNIVRKNTCKHNAYGIVSDPSSNDQIDSNTVQDTPQYAVWLVGSSSDSVTNNVISNASTGIFVQSASGSNVSGNLIENSSNTMVVSLSTNTVILGNTLQNNTYNTPVIDSFSMATLTTDIQLDSDGDGVLDNVDQCPGSVYDSGPVAGTYAWQGGDYFKTLDQKTKQLVDSKYSMAQTGGCICAQILSNKAGNNEGELKNGCTQGTMENFLAQKGSIKPSTLNAIFDGSADAVFIVGLLLALVVGFVLGKRK